MSPTASSPTPADRADSRPLAADRAKVRLKGVKKSFGRQQVLKGIDLEFPTGLTTVVLGPSGCGKSVLLKHIVGLLRPDQGEVWFEGQRIDTLRDADLVAIRRKIGFLFQQGAMFDSMSVRENIAFPLREHLDLPEAQRNRRIMDVLKMVGLAESIDKMPADLSGGQRKRAALARAIVLEPSLMLYDEPTTGLDPIRADLINELILKLKHEFSMTSIVVTHDLTSAFKVADRMVMLHEGHVLLQGEPEVFKHSTDPIVERFLRGEATEEELSAIRSHSASDAGSRTDSKEKR